jgi:hypothetical protein
VRTITTHPDMATAARGFGISTWTLLPFIVLPSLLACWHLFRRLLPLVLGRTCGRDPLRGAFVAATACAIFFGFYGVPAVGGDYGDVSAVVSILSIFGALPLMLMATLPMRGLHRMSAAQPYGFDAIASEPSRSWPVALGQLRAEGVRA